MPPAGLHLGSWGVILFLMKSEGSGGKKANCHSVNQRFGSCHSEVREGHTEIVFLGKCCDLIFFHHVIIVKQIFCVCVSFGKSCSKAPKFDAFNPHACALILPLVKCFVPSMLSHLILMWTFTEAIQQSVHPRVPKDIGAKFEETPSRFLSDQCQGEKLKTWKQDAFVTNYQWKQGIIQNLNSLLWNPKTQRSTNTKEDFLHFFSSLFFTCSRLFYLLSQILDFKILTEKRKPINF